MCASTELFPLRMYTETPPADHDLQSEGPRTFSAPIPSCSASVNPARAVDQQALGQVGAHHVEMKQACMRSWQPPQCSARAQCPTPRRHVSTVMVSRPSCWHPNYTVIMQPHLCSTRHVGAAAAAAAGAGPLGTGQEGSSSPPLNQREGDKGKTGDEPASSGGEGEGDLFGGGGPSGGAGGSSGGGGGSSPPWRRYPVWLQVHRLHSCMCSCETNCTCTWDVVLNRYQLGGKAIRMCMHPCAGVAVDPGNRVLGGTHAVAGGA